MSSGLCDKNERFINYEFYFRDYANNDVDKWKTLIGKKVLHNNNLIGEGIIKDIYSEAKGVYIKILFDTNCFDANKEKILAVSSFENFCTIENLIDIEEFNNFIYEKDLEKEIYKIKEKEKFELDKKLEEENKRKFEEWLKYKKLCDKYNVILYNSKEKNINESLYRILKIVENHEDIGFVEIMYLEANDYIYSYLLAIIFKEKYTRNNEEWDLIKASKYFRMAGYPQKALDITENFISEDKQIKSAYWTTRGGAYRDLLKYDLARKCANKAILINPTSYYPYNLIGAIEFSEKNFASSMKNFKRAAMLGAKTIGLSKEEIIETMETLSDLQKNYIKSQLLEINYSKYKWVNEI